MRMRMEFRIREYLLDLKSKVGIINFFVFEDAVGIPRQVIHVYVVGTEHRNSCKILPNLLLPTYLGR